MNHFQKKQQGFDLFDFIFKNQADSIYCASNNTNFENVKVFVKIKRMVVSPQNHSLTYFNNVKRMQKRHLELQTLLVQMDQLLDMHMLLLKLQDFMINHQEKFMKLFKFEIHGVKLNGKANGVIKMQFGIRFDQMKKRNITKMLPMAHFGCLLPTF